MAFIKAQIKTEQRKYERARLIASAMADTSKVVFPWERKESKGKPKKLKRLDKDTINQILERHGINTRKTKS